jgi:hypothetical protein
MSVKITAFVFIGLQIVLFIVSTSVVLWVLRKLIKAGAGFNSPFESIQFWRLVFTLIPYAALPICMIAAIVFYNNEEYLISIWMPLAFLAFTLIISYLYLRIVPDPIAENFGPRPSPYPGFLVLPADAVPLGFKEVRHHYSKTEYSINFSRHVGSQYTYLSISESETATYSHGGARTNSEFLHSGIVGHVYEYFNEENLDKSLHLIWLNPPKQRVSIFLTQSSSEFLPDDVIDLFKKLR